MTTDPSQTINFNDLVVVPQSKEKFKFSSIIHKTIKNKLLHELIRFAIYASFILVILSLINRNSPSTIYSIVQMDQSDKSIFVKKQIPGIFPTLTSRWEKLLKKWNVRLMRGRKGSQNLDQNSYQLEFKHFDQKQDVVYITRTKCKGHIIMNWQILGSNIYFTQFVPPKSSMIIPNDPQDEKCIEQNGQIVSLLRYSTIWAIAQENLKTALFLLIEQVDDKNEKNNYVLVANEQKKL